MTPCCCAGDSYFICILNYILAWRYLFSVTQINVFVLIICVRLSAERVQSWWKSLDSHQWKLKPPAPHNSCLQGCCRAMHPSSAPRPGRGSCSCHPRELVHVRIVCLRMLPTVACYFFRAPTMLDMWGKIQSLSQSPIHIESAFPFCLLHSAQLTVETCNCISQGSAPLGIQVCSLKR